MSTYTFGNRDLFVAQRAEYVNGRLIGDPLELPRPTINEDDYERALEDINRSWAVFEDDETGKTFELSGANLQAGTSKGVDFEALTFTSAHSTNIGNDVETAEHAALHPDRQRWTVGSFGVGKTSYWDKAEREYIKKTGRWIQEDGQPLPTVAALARVLKMADLVVTRLTSNSAGGAHNTALMHALPPGQVTHYYDKSRPNISEHGHWILWGLGVVLGDIRDDRKFKRESEDPWKMTKARTEAAKLLLPRLFSDDDAKNVARSIPDAAHAHSLKKLWTDTIAFSRGLHSLGCSPAAIDTAMARHKQPNALLTYHFPRDDRLYNGMNDVQTFMREVDSLDPHNTHVQALVMPGAHRDHTQYPGLRWTFEKYAFERER